MSISYYLAKLQTLLFAAMVIFAFMLTFAHADQPEGFTPAYEDDAVAEPSVEFVEEGFVDSSKSATQRATGVTQVTLLMLYTDGFATYYGASTQAQLQSIFDIAKDIFANSLSDVNLTLIQAQQLPITSQLNDTSDLAVALSSLGSDGYVRYLRELYGADIVSLVGKYVGSGGCGKAYTPVSSTSSFINAFSVALSGFDNNTGYYCQNTTLAHEIAHNFGCAHDRANSSLTPMYSYAYGYGVSGQFETVMSYGIPEIQYFSNPNILYNGAAIGVASGANAADNARAIRDNRSALADNSEQISSSLESGDSLINLHIEGTFFNADDRDGFEMMLDGNTTFTRAYPNYYYINLYSTTTYALIGSYPSSTTIDLPRDRYRVVISKQNDQTLSRSINSLADYAVDITTQYRQVIAPVTSYLLD